MNLRRYEKCREGAPNLGAIAGHLDAPSLLTVTAKEGPERRTTIETAPSELPSAVFREVLQKWPLAAKAAYEAARMKHALIVPEIGAYGIVCVSTDRHLHVWTVAKDDTLSCYKCTMPVDADILAMACLKPKSTLSTRFGQYLLILAYEREVCLFTLNFLDGIVHFGTTGLSAMCSSIPSVIGGGCDGRIFLGTRDGRVYELDYNPYGYTSFVWPCSLTSLGGWLNPSVVYGNPVEKLLVDEASNILVVIGRRSTLALFSLGPNGQSIPIRRVSYNPPLELGQFNFVTLLTILPMDREQHAFQGMCIFSDGKRMKIRLSHDDSLTWNTVNWITNWAIKSTFDCDSARNAVPLAPPHVIPVDKLTHVSASSDGTAWLLCESTADGDALSVLRFLDADPVSRMENGGVFHRQQLRMTSPLLAVGRREAVVDIENYGGFVKSTDFISQQFDPAISRHVILDGNDVSVVRIQPAVEILANALDSDNDNDIGNAAKHFGRCYGRIETAAMLCMVGHRRSDRALRLFGREDLFGHAKMVKRIRPISNQDVPQSRPMGPNGQPFTRNETIETEDDIEFSDAFKGVVLVLRQLLVPFWWTTVFDIVKDRETGVLHAAQTLSEEGLGWTIGALSTLQTFVTDHIKINDPRVGHTLTFPNEMDQIELFESMNLMILVRRCLEAAMLLAWLHRREITSIIGRLTEPECEALAAMSFNQLVFSPKLTSPVTPLLKATLRQTERDVSAYSKAHGFFVQYASTFWNEKDRDAYEALRSMQAQEEEQPRQVADQTYRLLNRTLDG